MDDESVGLDRGIPPGAARFSKIRDEEIRARAADGFKEGLPKGLETGLDALAGTLRDTIVGQLEPGSGIAVLDQASGVIEMTTTTVEHGVTKPLEGANQLLEKSFTTDIQNLRRYFDENKVMLERQLAAANILQPDLVPAIQASIESQDRLADRLNQRAAEIRSYECPHGSQLERFYDKPFIGDLAKGIDSMFNAGQETLDRFGQGYELKALEDGTQSTSREIEAFSERLVDAAQRDPARRQEYLKSVKGRTEPLAVNDSSLLTDAREADVGGIPPGADVLRPTQVMLPTPETQIDRLSPEDLRALQLELRRETVEGGDFPLRAARPETLPQNDRTRDVPRETPEIPRGTRAPATPELKKPESPPPRNDEHSS